MRTPKVRELQEAVRSLFSRPITTRFPAEPAVVVEGFRGITRFDERTCIGCGACAQVCPAGAIQVVDDPGSHPPTRTLSIRYDVCIFCGHCGLNCTTGTGISNTKEYELIAFDRSTMASSVEKELVLCEECHEPISTRDHILWTAEKLGVKRFANPTLALVAERTLGLVDETPAPPPDPSLRPNAVRVMCPKCRRTSLVAELWG